VLHEPSACQPQIEQAFFEDAERVCCKRCFFVGSLRAGFVLLAHRSYKALFSGICCVLFVKLRAWFLLFA
jgi:hypothetical protein